MSKKEDIRGFLTAVGAAILMLVLLISLARGCKVYQDSQKEQYCGIVKRMYESELARKMRVYSEKHIVFYCARTNSNIDIEVTDNTYANCKIGGGVCFMLWEEQTK